MTNIEENTENLETTSAPEATPEVAPQAAPQAAHHTPRQGAPANTGRGPGGNRGAGGGNRGPNANRSGKPGGSAPDSVESFLAKEANEWHEKVLQIRRVTKVVKGGKKMSFRAVVIVGNGNGQVGFGTGKSGEVVEAIRKAVVEAKKALVEVPIHKTTIPHIMKASYGSSDILLKPASEGTGVIAGGAVRSIMEALGVKDVLAKSLGASNRMNVVKAALNALAKLRSLRHVAHTRGKTTEQIMKGSHGNSTK